MHPVVYRKCSVRVDEMDPLLQYADKLNGSQRRRYTNVVKLIGNVDRLLLIRNDAWRFFSYVLWPSNYKSMWYYVLATWFYRPVYFQSINSRNTSFLNIGLQPVHKWMHAWEKNARARSCNESWHYRKISCYNYDVEVFNIESTATYRSLGNFRR